MLQACPHSRASTPKAPTCSHASVAVPRMRPWSQKFNAANSTAMQRHPHRRLDRPHVLAAAQGAQDLTDEEPPIRQSLLSQAVRASTSWIGFCFLALWRLLLCVPRALAALCAMSGEDWARWRQGTWAAVKREAKFYWAGTKVLGHEMGLASRYAARAVTGRPLTRRERAQVVRTSADMVKLIPMIVIIVLPFMELALPVLLRLFPGMLPSTYEDKARREQEERRGMEEKRQAARKLQAMMADMSTALVQDGSNTQEEVQEFNQVMRKARTGQQVATTDVLMVARLLGDRMAWERCTREQLVAMCQFAGVATWAPAGLMRSRLNSHVHGIQKDDKEIEQEGLQNMTADELRAACRARGLSGDGPMDLMQRQMQAWLDLSLRHGLCPALLLLSSALTLTAQTSQGDAPQAQQHRTDKPMNSPVISTGKENGAPELRLAPPAAAA